MSYDLASGRKKMDPMKLASLLIQLPADCTVEVNTVGNLLITTKDDQYLGFVDFNGEKLEMERE